MSNALEDVAVIENLSVNNLASTPFATMLQTIAPYVLVDIPEDASAVDMKKRLDFLLARTANLHAFLTYLAVFASEQRAVLKKSGSAEAAEDMLKKKEALYELASAVKLKYEACSRKITLAMSEEGDDKVSDRVDYSGRASAPRPQWSQPQTAAANSATPPQTTTASAPARPAAPKKSGGWNSV